MCILPGIKRLYALPEIVSYRLLFRAPLHLYRDDLRGVRADLLLGSSTLPSIQSRVWSCPCSQAAVEFCMNLNTKINRRKLIKTLFNVPRTR